LKQFTALVNKITLER